MKAKVANAYLQCALDESLDAKHTDFARGDAQPAKRIVPLLLLLLFGLLCLPDMPHDSRKAGPRDAAEMRAVATAVALQDASWVSTCMVLWAAAVLVAHAVRVVMEVDTLPLLRVVFPCRFMTIMMRDPMMTTFKARGPGSAVGAMVARMVSVVRMMASIMMLWAGVVVWAVWSAMVRRYKMCTTLMVHTSVARRMVVMVVVVMVMMGDMPYGHLNGVQINGRDYSKLLAC
mmetsp:Transcript_16736/g.38663  ORF Transcript_16736/g.38663 Transcript_16736/m.38663 type:complete len:231 (-) Transcript_16736:2850-3542(-)